MSPKLKDTFTHTSEPDPNGPRAQKNRLFFRRDAVPLIFNFKHDRLPRAF
jgi:hypothetical protein